LPADFAFNEKGTQMQTNAIETINFQDDAARLIAEWADMNEDDRNGVSTIDKLEGIPFTVYDDFSVCMGHYTDGIYATGSNIDAAALAQCINDCAAMLDHQPSDMTGNPEHDKM